VARLASEVGFADQSHLCRVMRDEYGSTPGMMRRALDRQ
jgi:AraC-like DNA-binding protein